MSGNMPIQKGFDPAKVKVGDVVIRALAGVLVVECEVTALDDTLIHCSKTRKPGQPWADISPDEWTFSRQTGCEVDVELGWGQQPDGQWITGSYLIGVLRDVP